MARALCFLLGAFVGGAVVTQEYADSIGADFIGILLSNGSNGHTYISVILGSTDHDSLYRNMTTLLTDIK